MWISDGEWMDSGLGLVSCLISRVLPLRVMDFGFQSQFLAFSNERAGISSPGSGFVGFGKLAALSSIKVRRGSG